MKSNYITFRLSFSHILKWILLSIFSVQYFMFLYQYFKEWRKNPHWSFSCCLALLLPLNDLQGEVHSMADTNILKTQLQSGAMETPSIAVVAKDSGIMSIALTYEEDKHCDDETTESVQERNCKVASTTTRNVIERHRQRCSQFQGLL